jgi:hypothetical protein
MSPTLQLPWAARWPQILFSITIILLIMIQYSSALISKHSKFSNCVAINRGNKLCRVYNNRKVDIPAFLPEGFVIDSSIERGNGKLNKESNSLPIRVNSVEELKALIFKGYKVRSTI